MPTIPNESRAWPAVRSNLEYCRYSEATWRWWCGKNNAEFIKLDGQLGGSVYQHVHPTFKRWLAPEILIGESCAETRIAMVDADTMVRWDTPNLFEAAAGQLAAVRGQNRRYICKQLAKYKRLFPSVEVPWWEYFNAGIVLVTREHLPVLRAFAEFLRLQWPAFSQIEGTSAADDQTLLNYVVRASGIPVRLLPDPYNLLHCFPVTGEAEQWELRALQSGLTPSLAAQHSFASHAFSGPDVFDFINQGYVWHFTSVVAMRSAVMRETWRRVQDRYPGTAFAE
jgi:hypothetical protein